MKRLLSVLVVLACTLLVSSCALVRFAPVIVDDSHQKANARMEQIVEGLNNRDADALKGMFSHYALENATGVDDGLEYLLSYFPNGGVTWEGDAVNSAGHNNNGKKSELLRAYYKVSADGNDYWFYFADFTINEVENPDNVGIYALGVAPWTEDRRSGASGPFFSWAGAIGLTEDGENGYPGVYVPQQ